MNRAQDHWQADYDTLTQRCGAVWLDGLCSVVLRGNDRTSFLHNMCTNDIRGLPVGHLREAFLTDVKGKVQGHGLVLAEQGQLTLLAAPGLAGPIVAHLDRYIVNEDVQLVDASGNDRWWLIVGPQAATQLASVIDAALIAPAQAGQFVTGSGADDDWLLARVDLLPAPCFLLRSNTAASEAFGESIPVLHDWQACNALRIEGRFPLQGIDFDASHLSQEIGREDRAISFTKGCYLGQETVARIDALGHVNKKLTLIRFEQTAVPPVGTELRRGERVVATVSSSTWSPRWAAPIALAMVQHGAEDESLESTVGPARTVEYSE